MTGQLTFNGLTAYIARDGNGGFVYRIGAFQTSKQITQFARYPGTFVIDQKTGIAQHYVKIQVIEESPAAADATKQAWEALQRSTADSITISYGLGGGSITRPNCELMSVNSGEIKTYVTTTGAISKSVVDIELEFVQCSES